MNGEIEKYYHYGDTLMVIDKSDELYIIFRKDNDINPDRYVMSYDRFFQLVKENKISKLTLWEKAHFALLGYY